MKILIVTQSGVLRTGLRTLLTALSEDFSVDFEAWIPSAVQSAREKGYSLVFWDARLPFKDLMEAIRSVKSACPHTHCIAIIEKNDQVGPVKVAGAEEVICSGFSADHLFRLINRYSPG